MHPTVGGPCSLPLGGRNRACGQLYSPFQISPKHLFWHYEKKKIICDSLNQEDQH